MGNVWVCFGCFRVCAGFEQEMEDVVTWQNEACFHFTSAQLGEYVGAAAGAKEGFITAKAPAPGYPVFRLETPVRRLGNQC